MPYKCIGHEAYGYVGFYSVLFEMKDRSDSQIMLVDSETLFNYPEIGILIDNLLFTQFGIVRDESFETIEPRISFDLLLIESDGDFTGALLFLAFAIYFEKLSIAIVG